MGKPIKDWGVVKFLTKKLPKAGKDIATNVADVVIGGESVSKAVGDIIRGNEGDQLSKEDIAKAYELAELDQKRYQMELADRQDARSMQVENLKHGDRFTKRFVYWYAGAMTFLIFVVLILLFFVEIPSDNKRIIDMIIGGLVTTGLSGIFQYFFGSSSGSKQKQGMLQGVLDKINEVKG